MSLSINNVRGVLSSVSFDNEISSKKQAAGDTFEMVRGGNYLKSHKSANATGKDGKCSSSSCKVDNTQAQAQAQNQAQNLKEADAKVADAKEEQAQAQGQSQAQAQGQAQAAQAQKEEADAKAKFSRNF